jgi:hypothetical protein
MSSDSDPGTTFLIPDVIDEPKLEILLMAIGTIRKIKITRTMNNMIPPVIKRIFAIRFAFVELSDITFILYKEK